MRAGLYDTVQRIRGTMNRNPRLKADACGSSRGRTSARFDSLQRSLRGPAARSTTCSPLMHSSEWKLTRPFARSGDSDSHA
jgi:hypothetical protein